jgi:tRNA threonylcarbamoyladenosine biosynthesis protein TsaB
MKILAIDTSADIATCAICEDDRLLAEVSVKTRTHSAIILPAAESLMKSAGIGYGDIGMYSVSAGPGSFTGIRIGVAAVKGLAFPHSTPCVGVSSLEAMAYSLAGIPCIAVPVIDARRDMVYTALFRSLPDGTVERLCEDTQIAITELVETLAGYGDEAIYLTGDAYDKVKAAADPGRIAETPVRLRWQSAYGVARAAFEKWNTAPDRSVFTDAALNPVYLKKSQAEREREERLAEEK